MARSWRVVALAWMGAVFFWQAANAQERAKPDVAAELTGAKKSEAPESIFNGQVRRYRFDLEGTVVTADTAEGFVVQYRGRDKQRPPIFGAYADDEHNALVVVAPPEAEQAIRESLAEWIIATAGIESSSLRIQRRELAARWRTVLSGMAECEVRLVELTGDRGQQLKDRLRQFHEELGTLEKQIQMMDRYIARLAAGPSPGQ